MIVETVRAIIDAVRPTRAVYALETMPWMYPNSPDNYLQLLRAIDRPGQFGVHLDPVNLVNSPDRFFRNADLIRECFAKLGPHLVSCHLKDIALRPNLTVHLDEVRPGLGSLDYATFLREAARLDADLPVMLEHLPDAGRVPGCRHSLALRSQQRRRHALNGGGAASGTVPSPGSFTGAAKNLRPRMLAALAEMMSVPVVRQWALLANIASTFYMVGVIWTVQLAHYPLMARVVRRAWRAYHDGHTRAMVWIVMAPMIVELGRRAYSHSLRPPEMPALSPLPASLRRPGMGGHVFRVRALPQSTWRGRVCRLGPPDAGANELAAHRALDRPRPDRVGDAAPSLVAATARSHKRPA
jgi:hypothetical protein